ncbi:S8 family serine peptidase [Shewanella electrodiphila]|uniref:S8 family serine peptidase n=1 Tax=Shewanella electrodiphila TaxID=934143 RepID=A0ABT0KKU7_9GAMM|nr:S8 family serine peptidase [Shewanella electrodiphila]MCL1044461.1 S8 family serine peptidase [Shewanella electrodiphila]
MRIKKLTLMTLAAIYAGGVGNVVADNGQHSTLDTPPQIPTSINMMELHKQKQQATQYKTEMGTTPLRRGSLSNIHYQPKSALDKINIEEGITGEHTYIVRLHDKPIATYNGTIPGLPSTKQALRQSTQQNSTNSASMDQQSIATYKSHLLSKQQQVISATGVTPNQQFTAAINAFTVKMTQQDAMRMAEQSEVAYIQRSTKLQLHTDVGPEHVGASGIWDGSQTPDGQKYQGEGMVVGIIDTGVNTDHPSFAAVGGDGYVHTNPLGAGNYFGGCAEADFADKCNDKLIGVYTHESITGQYPESLQFGEDYNGHGSHVASTVAGNILYDVDVVTTSLGGGPGNSIGVQMPMISGVAPHANIISYQVCTDDGCPGDAILFGIEQAILDGVDAINMSIGGGESFPWNDAFEMAFLSAREAGIAVALSAGNSGAAYGTDSLYTVDHTSPWVLNVAATTHSRSINIHDKALNAFAGGDTTLTPEQLDGAGVSGEFSGNFVIAGDHGDARCNTPFAADTFQETDIVVCERGDIARVEKAINVQAGGAGGFVLYNTWDEGDDVFDDAYVIPGIHLTATQYFGSWNVKGLQPWLMSAEGETLTGTITASRATRDINPDDADWLATFSSRGPSSTVEELFSPGIAAPGVDIFAAWNDENPFNSQADTRNYNAISGTSMASPHVAGMMALIRQANPTWTASQVQSALQMTADSMAIKTLHPNTGETKVAGVYRAGHGLANVERAINAGLIMDETADNFRRANPQNGGLVRDLNLPQLINNDCGRDCSWLRTVTATQDGTWDVSVARASEGQPYWDYSLDPSANVSVTPSQFSLKKGESITLTINGSFQESDMAWHDGTIANAQGEIHFIATDETIPASHWPYSATFIGTTLPNTINVKAHDDAASHMIENVPFGVPANTLSGVVYTPVEATTIEFDSARLQFGEQFVDDQGFWNTDLASVTTFPVTVPENSAVFRAEITDRIKSSMNTEYDIFADADIMIFRDFNGDGMYHYSEAICGSQLPQTSIGEYCSLENPEAGEYVIMVQNYLMYPWESVDTYEMSYAVVAKDVTSDIQLSFSDSEELNSSLNIEWDMMMEEGKTYYSAAAIHAGANEEGSLTLVPMQMTRGKNTVSIDSTQDAARVGDIIDMRLTVQANQSGENRLVDIAASLSDGLRIIDGSLSESIAGVVATDNGFTVQVEQLNTADKQTDYIVTTNETDAMCRTPWNIEYLDGTSIDGEYVDLARFGMAPSWGSFYEVNEWGWGTWTHEIIIPTIDNAMAPFDNEEYFVTDQVVLSSRGWLQLDYVQYNPWDIMPQKVHLELPATEYTTPADFIVAPLWNASQDENWNQKTTLSMYEPSWDPALQKGVTVAYFEGYTLVEWDKASTHDFGYDENWQQTITPRDDSYDFQVFMRERTGHVDGEYEYIMAYNNVDVGSQDGSGSIGVRGYNGPRAGMWPLNGHQGESFAYNDLNDKLKDGLVVCYNIDGPQSSRITIEFQAEVIDAALGMDQEMTVTGTVDGIADASATQTITVASNINMLAIDDQMVEENMTLEGITVHYTDNDGGMSANTITVTGENVTAVVNGHTSGSSFDITPAADFWGETMVTVTVSDNLFPNDMSTTTFMLTVNSDGVEPTPPAAENPIEPEATPDNDDGGSLSLLGLVFLGLLGASRRKKYH